ncbi:MAG TPA: ATP-binding cassette domain-containing protein, partial [Gemmatimonadales bacterium]|nr:ATP-binding cassette domain-containing protein [Gemmatimonadales bacterium]
MTEHAVVFRNVSKRYPHFALEAVSFELAPGTIQGFIGANGAGKSTTMRILMGLIAHDSGTVEVLGHPVPGEAAPAKQRIGYVAEDMRLFPSATLEWHMGFVARVFGGWDAAYAASLT